MSTESPEKTLRRLEWTVIRKLDGLLQGDYRTVFRGFGLELSDLREYQFGDDVRYIDWNVTARLQTPYVRQYVEDREVTAWFLLDLSPSVEFGTARTIKKQLVVDFVGVLSRIFARHGNRVGAIIFSNSVDRIIPARSGRLHILHLIDTLQTVPRARTGPLTDLAGLLEGALRTVRRRSLIFVVSDFISQPGWERPLGTLAQRHEVIAVRLYDPRETEMPDVGVMLMEDSETGEQLYVDTHSRSFRERFAAAALRREQDLLGALARAGLDMLSLSTGGDMAREILRFAALRRQKKTLPASFGKRPAGRGLARRRALAATRGGVT